MQAVGWPGQGAPPGGRPLAESWGESSLLCSPSRKAAEAHSEPGGRNDVPAQTLQDKQSPERRKC